MTDRNLILRRIERTEMGTPQGGNLSPLLSNIMLNELDKELENRGLHFARYADDCIIAVKSEASAKRVMHSITSWIERKLGLKQIFLLTDKDVPAYEFYKKNGYVEVTNNVAFAKMI